MDSKFVEASTQCISSIFLAIFVSVFHHHHLILSIGTWLVSSTVPKQSPTSPKRWPALFSAAHANAIFMAIWGISQIWTRYPPPPRLTPFPSHFNGTFCHCVGLPRNAHSFRVNADHIYSLGPQPSPFRLLPTLFLQWTQPHIFLYRRRSRLSYRIFILVSNLIYAATKCTRPQRDKSKC